MASPCFGLRCLILLLGLGMIGYLAPGADQSPRQTPVVQAVKKAAPSVVALTVQFIGNYGSVRPVYGTGVIVDERGFILTNSHVVGTITEALVDFSDGTQSTAVVVWNSPDKDLAVLRLPKGKEYPSINFAPSSDLILGETVVALGNPFGYQHSVSAGVISAVDRTLYKGKKSELRSIIQTTAAINPGNSGGALVNLEGELVGVVSAMRDGAENIAFAIAIDSVDEALATQARKGSPEPNLKLGLLLERHLRESGSPRQRLRVKQADNPIFKVGDIIDRVGDRRVGCYFDLERALLDVRSGDTVVFQVERDGTMTNLNFKIP